MVFFVGKEFVRCTIRGYGNQRLLAANVLIVSRVVNHGIKCASIRLAFYSSSNIHLIYTLRTKEKGHRMNSSVE